MSVVNKMKKEKFARKNYGSYMHFSFEGRVWEEKILLGWWFNPMAGDSWRVNDPHDYRFCWEFQQSIKHIPKGWKLPKGEK